jgi:hypothetical protein
MNVKQLMKLAHHGVFAETRQITSLALRKPIIINLLVTFGEFVAPTYGLFRSRPEEGDSGNVWHKVCPSGAKGQIFNLPGGMSFAFVSAWYSPIGWSGSSS